MVIEMVLLLRDYFIRSFVSLLGGTSDDDSWKTTTDNATGGCRVVVV